MVPLHARQRSCIGRAEDLAEGVVAEMGAIIIALVRVALGLDSLALGASALATLFLVLPVALPATGHLRGGLPQTEEAAQEAAEQPAEHAPP